MKMSGIGGQAVLEGIMMKNGDNYAVAVRKPDKEIEVEVKEYHGVGRKTGIRSLPFIRGVFNFADSLVLGMQTLMRGFLKVFLPIALIIKYLSIFSVMS